MHCIEHVKCIKRDVYTLLPLKVKYYKTNMIYTPLAMGIVCKWTMNMNRRVYSAALLLELYCKQAVAIMYITIIECFFNINYTITS